MLLSIMFCPPITRGHGLLSVKSIYILNFKGHLLYISFGKFMVTIKNDEANCIGFVTTSFPISTEFRQLFNPIVFIFSQKRMLVLS